MLMIHKYVLLLPIASLLMAGCPAKQPEEEKLIPDEIQKEFDEAEALKFDYDFASTLGEAVDAETANKVSENAFNKFNKASSIKKTYVQFEKEHWDGDHNYNGQCQTKITVFTDNNYIMTDKFSYGKTDEQPNRKPNTYHFDDFYNSQQKINIEQEVINGHHRAQKYDWSKTKPETIEQQLAHKYKTFFTNEFMDLNSCGIYKNGTGYIACEVSDTEPWEESEGVYALSLRQNIYEISSDYRITKATEFNQEITNYNIETKQGTLTYSNKMIIAIDYSERKDGVSEVRDIERLYSTPHFDYGAYGFDIPSSYIKDCLSYSDVDTNKVRIEAYASFNTYVSEEITVTPSAALSKYVSLYDCEIKFIDRNDQLQIKNTDLLRYDGETLMFKMNAATDALYVVSEYELNKDELVYKGGTIEIRDVFEMEDYFNELIN